MIENIRLAQCLTPWDFLAFTDSKSMVTCTTLHWQKSDVRVAIERTVNIHCNNTASRSQLTDKLLNTSLTF